MPAKLSVNLNAIAMLRNRRDLPWPDVAHFGQLALAAGASGLTVHPRPDQRHIRFSDLPVLRALIDDSFPKAEFNIEGYPTEDFLVLCEKTQPEQVTLVPDDPSQATSDHGWDFRKHGVFLKEVVERLKAGGMRVSLFADGDGNASRWNWRLRQVRRVSNFTPAPMAAALTIRKRARRFSKSSDRRRIMRERSDLPSMPAMTSPSQTCPV